MIVNGDIIVRETRAMSEREAFLRAICESPDDDAPRLIYADWLEERGDPLSEFIRVECAMVGLAREDPRFRRLWVRDLELLRRHKDKWFGRVRQKLAWWETRRGFMDEVRTDAATFLEHAEELFRFNPAVRHVKVTATGEHLPGLAACRHLQWVTQLDLSQNVIGDPGIQVLAASPHLGRLHALDLRGCGIGPAGARTLAESPLLAQLVHLNLGANQIGDAGVEALLGSPYFVRPLRLHLDGIQGLDSDTGQRGVLRPNIGNAGAIRIATSSKATQLLALDLAWNDLEESGFEALATSPYLADLTALRIWEEPFREALATSPYLADLTALRTSEEPFRVVTFPAGRKTGFRRLQERFGERLWIDAYMPPSPDSGES
jgi:uncharacterized protein (TIGR02996 family)